MTNKLLGITGVCLYFVVAGCAADYKCTYSNDFQDSTIEYMRLYKAEAETAEANCIAKGGVWEKE